jgi:plastocyanin
MRKAQFLTVSAATIILVFVIFLAVSYRPPSSPSSTPVFSATPSPTANSTQNSTIGTIKDNYFLPTNLTVQIGTTVRWVNNGSDIHTTTSFASGSGGNEFLLE